MPEWFRRESKVTRPEFNPTGLPESVKARCIKKAARSWCYVAPGGGTFYITEQQARGMQTKNGGEIYAPVAA